MRKVKINDNEGKSVEVDIDEFKNIIESKITPNLFNLPVFVGKNSNKNANVILSLIKEKLDLLAKLSL